MIDRDSLSQVAVECLRSCGRVVTLRPTRWHLLPMGTVEPIDVRRVGDWLRLCWRADPPQRQQWRDLQWSTPGDLLRANAALPGRAKFSLDPHHLDWQVSAEILLDDDVDLTARIAESVAGIVDAQRCAREGHGLHDQLEQEDRVALSERWNQVDPPDREAWLRLARESGWPFQARTSGPAFRLDIPDQFMPACVRQADDGPCQLLALLDGPSEWTAASRAACEQLLAEASGVVRLARTIELRDEQESRFAWEVRWPAPPSPVELRHALAALSVGVSLTSREVQALADEQLARRFLDVRGWSSPMTSLLPEATAAAPETQADSR